MPTIHYLVMGSNKFNVEDTKNASANIDFAKCTYATFTFRFIDIFSQWISKLCLVPH